MRQVADRGRLRVHIVWVDAVRFATIMAVVAIVVVVIRPALAVLRGLVTGHVPGLPQVILYLVVLAVLALVTFIIGLLYATAYNASALVGGLEVEMAESE